MSSELIALFGRNAGPISLAIMASFTALVTIAFRQGRSIKIGRFIIGSRPGLDESHARAGSIAPSLDGAALRSNNRFGKVDKVFEVSHAKEFYSTMAMNYDERNSANLLATQLETIVRIEKARELKSSLRVLDLGGGTGQNIATHFFSDKDIRWTYVDFCPAMVEQLDHHLAGQPMYRNLHKIVGDIIDIHRCLPSRSYDVVLLSLVLSSMPRLPDFTKIARLLAPGGMLIVSDINPLYTEHHPYYMATALGGSIVAMRMKQVDPIELCERAVATGLRQPHLTWQPELAQGLPGSPISYSFLATFTCAMESRSKAPGPIRPTAVRRRPLDS